MNIYLDRHNYLRRPCARRTFRGIYLSLSLYIIYIYIERDFTADGLAHGAHLGERREGGGRDSVEPSRDDERHLDSEQEIGDCQRITDDVA